MNDVALIPQMAITATGVKLPLYEKPEDFMQDFLALKNLEGASHWALGDVLVAGENMPDAQLEAMGVSREQWDVLWMKFWEGELSDGVEPSAKYKQLLWVCSSIPQEHRLPVSILEFSYFRVLAKVYNQLGAEAYRQWLQIAVDGVNNRSRDNRFSVAIFQQMINKEIQEEKVVLDMGEDGEVVEADKPVTLRLAVPQDVFDAIEEAAREEDMSPSQWVAQLVKEELQMED